MEQRMRVALTEVNCILENSEEEVTSKIPQKFKDFLNINMDKEFKPSFIPGLAIFAQPISMEAKELLKLVYRDFLATEDERNFIIQKEHKILEKSENKKEKDVEKAQKEEVEKVLENAQKNEVEKVLENSQKEEVKEKEEENQPIKNLQLIKVEEKWYKKLIRKLKNLVNRVKM